MPYATGSRFRQFAWMGVAAILLSAFAAGPALATDLTGTWTGHWKSHTNGHEGPMKARFKRINACQYQVRFSGRFYTIIPFCYTETMNIIADDGQTVELSASSKLCVFGTFHMRAAANHCDFNANYAAASDQGFFRLSRTGN
jgi:hypothetical protein